MKCSTCGSDLVVTIGGYTVCDNCEIIYEIPLALRLGTLRDKE